MIYKRSKSQYSVTGELHFHRTAVLHFVRLNLFLWHHDAKKRDYCVATSTATSRNVDDMATTATIEDCGTRELWTVGSVDFQTCHSEGRFLWLRFDEICR